MYYDRQIKYLNYYENGERIKTAGFVRAVVRDDLCMMQIKINGLPFDGTFDRKVILKDADRESILWKIRIHEGEADTEEMTVNRRSMGESAMAYEDIEEILIPISDNKEVRCIWNIHKAESQNSKDKIITEKNEEDSIANKEETDRITEKYVKETLNNSETKEAEITADEYKQESAKNYKQEQKQEYSQNYMQGDINEKKRQNVKNIAQAAVEDKWSRLAMLYKHGNTCGSMSDCIVVKPEDFVILPDRYYGLINNSFLLHGYHNYGYMILARYNDVNNYKYYIGVPGNFYEKEVQVALMFGFEGFEGGQDYAEPGDFGYYMIEVGL
jgi:hypothetical protein